MERIETGWFQANPSLALLFDRRLLQQNRHEAADCRDASIRSLSELNRTWAVLTMDAANSAGQLLSFSATIHRKLIKKHKVKALGPTEIEEGGAVMQMAPVLEVWGKLDALRLPERTDWNEWLRDHYGHTREAGQGT
jgi:hypothetical protein